MAPESSLNGSTSEQRVSDLLHNLSSLGFWTKPDFQTPEGLNSEDGRICIAGQKRAPQFGLWRIKSSSLCSKLFFQTECTPSRPESRGFIARRSGETPVFLFALCNLPQALAVLAGSLE